MRYYVIIADNADDMLHEIVICENCKYFRYNDKYCKRPHSCVHPDGPINPVPDGFCNYGDEKDDE